MQSLVDLEDFIHVLREEPQPSEGHLALPDWPPGWPSGISDAAQHSSASGEAAHQQSLAAGGRHREEREAQRSAGSGRSAAAAAAAAAGGSGRACSSAAAEHAPADQHSLAVANGAGRDGLAPRHCPRPGQLADSGDAAERNLLGGSHPGSLHPQVPAGDSGGNGSGSSGSNDASSGGSGAAVQSGRPTGNSALLPGLHVEFRNVSFGYAQPPDPGEAASLAAGAAGGSSGSGNSEAPTACKKPMQLHSVSFAVQPGEAIGIVGPPGEIGRPPTADHALCTNCITGAA